MDIMVPANMDDMRNWGNTLLLIGRLNLGISLAGTQAEGNLLFPRFYFNKAHPEWGTGYRAQVQSLKDHVERRVVGVAHRAVVRGGSHSADCLRDPVECGVGGSCGEEFTLELSNMLGTPDEALGSFSGAPFQVADDRRHPACRPGDLAAHSSCQSKL